MFSDGRPFAARRARPEPGPRYLHDTQSATDGNGRAIVRVKLSNEHRRCEVSKAVHDRIGAIVGNRQEWRLSKVGRPHVVVRSRGGGEAISVARFILGTAKHARIFYADGNPLNLREANVREGLSPDARVPKVKPNYKHNLVHHHRKGQEYVLKVKLTGETKLRATINKADYERLVTACGVTPWRVEGKGKHRRVVFETACPGIVQSVAEYVAGAPKDAAVVHGDGKFLNLRASNLAVASGGQGAFAAFEGG